MGVGIAHAVGRLGDAARCTNPNGDADLWLLALVTLAVLRRAWNTRRGWAIT